MGFFDKALGALVGAAAGFAVGGPGGAVAGGLGSLTGSTGKQAAAATTGIAALADPDIVRFASTPTTAEIAAKAALVTGGATGFMKNITRTTVQTIAPNGSVVRSTVLKGSPYLMNSDFVILKRTLRLVAQADDRVPRPRTRGVKAKVEQAHTQGLLEGIVAAASPTQAALIHHAKL